MFIVQILKRKDAFLRFYGAAFFDFDYFSAADFDCGLPATHAEVYFTPNSAKCRRYLISVENGQMCASRAVGTASKSITRSIFRTYGTANQSVKQFSTDIAYLKARFPDDNTPLSRAYHLDARDRLIAGAVFI